MIKEIKTTARQREVLEHLHGGAAYPYSIRHRAGGGAFRRMVGDMRERGLIEFDKERTQRWEVTAKGLRAIGVPSGVLTAREKLEAARAEAKQKNKAAFEALLVKRAAERKARIIAKVRKEFGFQGLSGDDDRLWELIQRIVDIEGAT